jgi:hypothetical protein
MDFEKIIRSQAFYIEPEDNDIVYVRASKLAEYIKNIVEKSFPVDKPVKPANGDFDNMIEELRARCILMPKEQTEHKFNAGLYWAIDMIKRYKEGKGFLQH